MPDWKHVHLLLTPELLSAVEAWRKQYPLKPDRNGAIRFLITKGLAAEGIQVEEKGQGKK